MSGLPINSSFYSVGGPLLQDAPSYLTRESDTELYKTLKAGKFCYVLNSRQMGKSSLMVRTLAKLEADGWVGSIIDFSGKDSQADRPDRWYNGIINQLNSQFELLEWQTFRTWLKDRDFIAPVERLAEFIEKVLLPGIEQPIVIFIDEIDSTLGLPFTDDFFALIRVCFNKRPQNPAYRRLTFALLGVAAPSELIGDAKRTPFNIGESIDLRGFTLKEALPLATGLQGKAEQPETVLQEILRLTGGQPFLTQRVCQLVVDSTVPIAEGCETNLIEGLVRSRVIEHWESQDHQEHLKTICKRLLDNEQKAGYLLELYRQIHQVGALSAQNQSEERELQLTGLVVKHNDLLKVYNPIYAAVFDNTWIDAELKKLRPYSESFCAWLASEKTDYSRLLRGEALTEAEQWALEKTLSVEDQEFLFASRIQQQSVEIVVREREAEIAAREREAALAREKTARDAAEAAEQIQMKATQQAQRKIRRGSLMLGSTLVAAFIFGGSALFSVNRLHVANQQRDEAQDLVQESEDEFNRIQAQKDKIAQELNQIEQKLKATREGRNQANEALAQSQESLKIVGMQRQEADEQLKQAQQAAQGQQVLLAQLKQDLISADATFSQAKQAQQEIATLNATTTSLVDLIDDLYDIDKPEAALDAIEQIGFSFSNFTHDSSELKQALLNSSIALAHLHLIPFPSDGSKDRAKKQINDAQTRIEQSVQLIETNPNVFSSTKSGRAIAFFSYAVKGNLQEEQDYLREEQESISSYPFYEKAFRYTPEITDYLPLDDVTRPFQRLPSSLEDLRLVEENQFEALVTTILQKHYDFRAKQLIRELKSVLEKHRWREADRLTWDAFKASSLSRDLDIACNHLKEMNALWYGHSAGRFGFKVQTNIYLETKNIVGQFNDEAYSRFIAAVGWKRIVDNESYFLSYNEPVFWSDIEGVSGEDLKVPIGHLPSPTIFRGLWGREIPSRTAYCNI